MALALYLVGIGVHSLFPWFRVPTSYWFLLFGIASYLVLAYAKNGKARPFIFAGAAFLVGAWRFDATIPSPQDGVMPWTGETIVTYGIVEEVHPYGPGSELFVRIEQASSSIIHGPGNKISVGYFYRSVPSVGSRVTVTCSVKNVQDTFLARKGAWAGCRGSSSVDVRGPPSRFDVLSILSSWRVFLTARISSLFPHDEGTLLTGILYGDQSMSADQRETMRRAGLTHLVAVSGSNVTIVVMVLLSFVLTSGFRRRHAFWIVTIGILAFLGFVGFSASVVRAGIMGWLVLFARHIGRAPSAFRLLAISAVVITTVDPWTLGFDAGFALSFLATWGLISWSPIISRYVQWIPERFGLREAFATTTSATLMTLPYLAWMFARMSLAGLVTNMLALPLVPFIMLWGAIVVAIGPSIPLVTLPAYGLLLLLEKIAGLANLVPFLDVQVQAMNFPFLVLSYLLIWRIWLSCSQKSELSTS